MTVFILAVLCLSCKSKAIQKTDFTTWGGLITQPSKSEKIEKKKVWESKKPKHYRYKLRISCDCKFDTSLYRDPRIVESKLGWLIIEIKNEYVISVKSFDGADITDYQSRVDYKDPIDPVFNFMIGEQTEYGYEKLFVVFDQEMGFPRFYLDTGEKGPPSSVFRFEIVEFENLDKKL